MKRFARIDGERVVEFLETEHDPACLFHAALVWIDVTSRNQVALNWTYDGQRFAAPVDVTPRPGAAKDTQRVSSDR